MVGALATSSGASSGSTAGLPQAAMSEPETKIGPHRREPGVSRQTLYRHVALKERCDTTAPSYSAPQGTAPADAAKVDGVEEHSQVTLVAS